MLGSILIFYLLRAGITFAAAPLEVQATMQDKVHSFVQSLQLVPSQNQSLISQLESAQNSNGRTTASGIDLACQVAQACLGPGSVETKPVNQTKVDANWSVIPQYSELPNANHSDEGLKRVGQRHHAYYFHDRRQRHPRPSKLSAFLKRTSLSVAAATPRIPAGPVSTTQVSLLICRG